MRIIPLLILLNQVSSTGIADSLEYSDDEEVVVKSTRSLGKLPLRHPDDTATEVAARNKAIAAQRASRAANDDAYYDNSAHTEGIVSSRAVSDVYTSPDGTLEMQPMEASYSMTFTSFVKLIDELGGIGPAKLRYHLSTASRIRLWENHILTKLKADCLDSDSGRSAERLVRFIQKEWGQHRAQAAAAPAYEYAKLILNDV